MKRLTIDQTWEQCLAMWKWISRRCKGKSERWCARNVSQLKIKWLEKNGIEHREISQDCFLCDRTTPKGDYGFNCSKCPALKLEDDFDCAESQDYPVGIFFIRHPREFYTKLKELNKIRLSK